MRKYWAAGCLLLAVVVVLRSAPAGPPAQPGGIDGPPLEAGKSYSVSVAAAAWPPRPGAGAGAPFSVKILEAPRGGWVKFQFNGEGEKAGWLNLSHAVTFTPE